MKVLYLTFYFGPDLSAGSFRNTALVEQLAASLHAGDSIHVITTLPNRYQSFKVRAPKHKQRITPSGCNVLIDRVTVPTHANGFSDQIRSFIAYYYEAHRLTKGQRYDLVVASSSRLFTAFLGSRIARAQSAPLFLDIRDIFRETILEIFGKSPLRHGLNPVLRAVEKYTFGYAKHINLVSDGFAGYFKPFRRAKYSYYTNGIDDEFLDWPLKPAIYALPAALRPLPAGPFTILYAGNVGEGQGLHKIIPQAARQLGDDYQFVVIGDGGAWTKLREAVWQEGVDNVELRPPVSRKQLRHEYQKASYLFVHLNDLEAFKRVLPSKVFEYAATDKPIIAGVAGFAGRFVRDHVDNHILFNPGDVDSLVRQLQTTPYQTQVRSAFVERFDRKTIAQQMAEQILQTAGVSAQAKEEPSVALV